MLTSFQCCRSLGGEEAVSAVWRHFGISEGEKVEQTANYIIPDRPADPQKQQ